MAASTHESYRFVPTRDGLNDLFQRYEAERRALGIASTFTKVSPQQQVDAIVTMLGLNAGRGWRPVPEESSRDLWLRYLGPVLAETREAREALRRAVRTNLPGQFEPRIDEPLPIRKPTRIRPDDLVPVQPPWWRNLDRMRVYSIGLLRQRAVLGVIVLVLGVAAFAWTVSYTGRADPNENPVPDKPPNSIPLRSSSIDGSETAPIVETGIDRAGQDYRFALDVTLTAVEQAPSAAITPEELAEIYAGESSTVADPAVFLSAMFGDWPLSAEQPVPQTRAGAFALTRYAKIFADIEGGIMPAPSRPALDQTSDEDQALRDRILVFAQSAQTSTTTGASSPSTASDWTSWLRWLAFLPVLPVLVWTRLSWVAAFKAQLTNPVVSSVGVAVDLPLQQLAMVAPPPARRLARQISWREPGIARRIHSEASVRATIRRGGFLTIVPRLRRRSADFVFLVPRRRKNDHERDRVSRFIDALKRGGLNLDVYDYDPDPRTLFPQRAGSQLADAEAVLDLRALRELHAEARLVLVTDGSELVDYFTQRPLNFVAEELASWPAKILLTPVPMDEWGEREMNLSEVLGTLIGRATPDGFLDFALAFGDRPIRASHLRTPGDQTGEDDGLGRLSAWLEAVEGILGTAGFGARRPESVRLEDPMLVSEAAPPDADQQTLISELQGWLGLHGFLWLAACAAYPQLRFAITLYLGLRLTVSQGAKALPLYNETHLARLTQLPWFRIGRMPAWLRRALFATLSNPARTQVREAVADMLNPGEKGLMTALPEEAHLPIWRLDDGGSAIPADAVMADLLFRDASEVDPVLRGGAFSAIFKQAAQRVRLFHALVLGTSGLWCLLAWWLWPNLGTPPYASGIWLPLLSFAVLTGIIGMSIGAIQTWLRRRVAPWTAVGTP